MRVSSMGLHGARLFPDGLGRLCSGVIVDEGDHDDAGRLEIVL